MYVAPELSEEAAEELTEAYMGMRKLGTGCNTITATPRQLESLIHLSEALAKMRLSKVVTLADVKEAVRLMKVAIHQAVTDPNTGLIGMDLRYHRMFSSEDQCPCRGNQGPLPHK
eukprot:TRINITY_DN2903_c0_g1_i7.p2 TRINITY_DN2903_c0_g1~~TRINITY_DN2903_c0_g1_i7.p2  ORF type:complete len:115 (+),score=26.17 TRINITY_DN2903_c0_g1_i7:369-713(+)